MFDKVFGIHERALLLRAERVGVLASNIANADTPNYKAKDLDFAAVLEGEQPAGGLQMQRTSVGHVQGAVSTLGDATLKYRVPFQPSLDGNTVEAPVEQAQFAENAVRYQSTLMFISRRVQSIENALTSR